MSTIKLYGADWCSMTKASRHLLDSLNISYEYIDIDHDREAAAWVASKNHGREKKPTIDINGTILSEPTDRELKHAVQEAGLI